MSSSQRRLRYWGSVPPERDTPDGGVVGVFLCKMANGNFLVEIEGGERDMGCEGGLKKKGFGWSFL